MSIKINIYKNYEDMVLFDVRVCECQENGLSALKGIFNKQFNYCYVVSRGFEIKVKWLNKPDAGFDTFQGAYAKIKKIIADHFDKPVVLLNPTAVTNVSQWLEAHSLHRDDLTNLNKEVQEDFAKQKKAYANEEACLCEGTGNERDKQVRLACHKEKPYLEKAISYYARGVLNPVFYLVYRIWNLVKWVLLFGRSDWQVARKEMIEKVKQSSFIFKDETVPVAKIVDEYMAKLLKNLANTSKT